MSGQPDGALPPPEDASADAVVRYRRRTVRFAPFGGTIETRLRNNQFYEGEMLRYIEALALPGTYVDVGGYVGTHALFLATYCPVDVVHTFEPRSRCYAHLTRNVEANGLERRVRVHQLGLSDRDESVPLTMHGTTESITCRKLDDLVRTRVALMKIDVEGMEPKVLAGATRILAADKPVIFVEAHTAEELGRTLAVLSPFGYRLTGRVFNSAATYEVAADVGSLPLVRSLVHPDAMKADDAAIVVSWPGGDAPRLWLESALPDEASGTVSQPEPIPVTPSAQYFLQTTGIASTGLRRARIVVSEYDRHGRMTFTRRHRFHPRRFVRLSLRRTTRRLRVTLRVEGPGVLSLDALALHELPRPHSVTRALRDLWSRFLG